MHSTNGNGKIARVEIAGHKVAPTTLQVISLRNTGLKYREISETLNLPLCRVEKAVKTGMDLGLVERKHRHRGAGCFKAVSLATGEVYWFANSKAIEQDGFDVSNAYKAAKGEYSHHAGLKWDFVSLDEYRRATGGSYAVSQ